MVTPLLKLTNESKSASIDAQLPYLATINYNDDTDLTFAVSLNGSGEVVITDYNDDFILSSEGDCIFGSDSQLIEGKASV